jgi:hypothetical protein
VTGGRPRFRDLYELQDAMVGSRLKDGIHEKRKGRQSVI